MISFNKYSLPIKMLLIFCDEIPTFSEFVEFEFSSFVSSTFGRFDISKPSSSLVLFLNGSSIFGGFVSLGLSMCGVSESV